jgi:hypothetical protein
MESNGVDKRRTKCQDAMVLDLMEKDLRLEGRWVNVREQSLLEEDVEKVWEEVWGEAIEPEVNNGDSISYGRYWVHWP